MVRILINDGIHEDGETLLLEAGYELHQEKIAQSDLPTVLPDYDAIIVRSTTKIGRDLIDVCPKLKVIARAGLLLDNIDVEYAQEKGILVMNTPAASAQSVAELVFAHMFNLARFLHDANRNMPKLGDQQFQALKNQYSFGIQLRGKTLGIIGFGRVGQEVARIGLALGMNVMPVDLKVNEANINLQLFNNDDVRLSVKVPTFEWDEVVENADFLTLHVPFSGGKPLIDADEIQKMKDGAYIINTSQGGAVDEDALLEALNSGKLAGAGIDVFVNEPTPRKEMLEHPKITTSPHIGASTLEARANIGLEIADKILAHFGHDD